MVLLNRDDPEGASVFLTCSFISYGHNLSPTIRLSLKKIVVIQGFFPNQNRIWQNNKGFCAFRLEELKALLCSYGKHVSVVLITIPRQACCHMEAIGSINFSLELSMLWSADYV